MNDRVGARVGCLVGDEACVTGTGTLATSVDDRTSVDGTCCLVATGCTICCTGGACEIVEVVVCNGFEIVETLWFE